jgi:adenylate cyclase
MFRTVMRRRNIEVDLAVMFVDLRGYTELSQSVGPQRVTEILNDFYDACAAAIWEHDGMLNKTIGDAVLALFNFPIACADHARRAVLAAQEIRRRCAARKSLLGADGAGLGLGIGIHSGLTAFGEFGRLHRDVTAIGNVVNLAARLQEAAAKGEILVTDAVLDKLGGESASAMREVRLKGFDDPVRAHLV